MIEIKIILEERDGEIYTTFFACGIMPVPEKEITAEKKIAAFIRENLRQIDWDMREN